MQPAYCLRKFLMKIGFVITLALSFNPVDALAEPVVITLPVVEQTEWVMVSSPLIDFQTKSKLFDDVDIPADQAFDHESPIDFFFRLIHYERLVQVHLDQWTISQAYWDSSFPIFIQNRLFDQPDDEDLNT